MDCSRRRRGLVEFCTSVINRKLQRPGSIPRWLAGWLAVVGLVSLETSSLQAWQVDESAQTVSSSDRGDERLIAGSRLLTPSSFGFSIPVAELQPTELANVETSDDWGNSVVARVQVMVGENYVVMLPNGRLVDRTAEQVQATDESFEPAKPNQIARELLEHDLANFSNMKFEKTRHYVFVYNTTEAFASVTRGILESMFSGVETYIEKQGIETRKAEVPLVVIMFNTNREFQAFRPMPDGVVAYYNMVTNHVVLHEESRLAATRPDLARGQLLSTIAHEGAHQILHNIGVQQRLSLWPMWLSEGLAEFFAPTSFGRRNRWKGAGKVNDLRMFELETYLQMRVIEGFDGDTVTRAVTARQLDSTGYATAWSIVHWLAKHKEKEFFDYVKALGHLGPLRGMAAREGEPVVDNLNHFHEFFGDDMEASENAMVDHLGRLDYTSPVAHLSHFVGMAIVPDVESTKRYACFFHTQEKVDAWKAALSASLTSAQLRGVQWDQQRFSDRRRANNAITRFLR